MKSFLLAIIINNKPGGFRAPAADSWTKSLMDLTSTDNWTIIDLRPMRDYLLPAKIQVNAEVRQLIFGFDAALVIGGAHPGSSVPN